MAIQPTRAAQVTEARPSCDPKGRSAPGNHTEAAVKTKQRREAPHPLFKWRQIISARARDLPGPINNDRRRWEVTPACARLRREVRSLLNYRLVVRNETKTCSKLRFGAQDVIFLTDYQNDRYETPNLAFY